MIPTNLPALTEAWEQQVMYECTHRQAKGGYPHESAPQEWRASGAIGEERSENEGTELVE